MNHVCVIAEAGVNHNGSVTLAEKMIDAACDAGADYIKFQTFIPSNMVSIYAQRASYQVDAMKVQESQLEMLSRLALTFSVEAVELSSYQLDRKNLVDFYEKQFIFEPTYFWDSAPIGKWMKQGGFLLSDGHHRQAYLLRKGYSLLPLRISKEDYGEWCNWTKEITTENKGRMLLPQMSKCFWESKGLFFSYQKLLERYFRQKSNWKILVEADSFGGYFGRRFSDMDVKCYFLSSLKDCKELLRMEEAIIFVIEENQVQEAMVEEIQQNYEQQFEVIQVSTFI